MSDAWKCAVCKHANKGDDNLCHWCGGHERIKIYPVRVPNMQQNTPSAEELIEIMAQEEASRMSDIALEEQIGALIAQYYAEKQEAQIEVSWTDPEK